MHGLTLAAVAFLLGGVTAACGSGDDDGDRYLEVHDMVQECRDDAGDDVSGSFQVVDGGDSILIDTENTSTDYSVMACILREIGTSSALMANIDATTALMGRQSEDDGDYHYSWSYHPDSGINMTITQK